MEPTEIKSAFEGLNKAWDEFKTTNADRIKAEAKGVFDGLIEEKLVKLNDEISAQEKKMAVLDAALAVRPKASAAEIKEEQRELAIKGTLAFVRGGADGFDRHADAEIKALRTNVGADGGFTIPTIIDPTMESKLVDISPIRLLAQVVQVSTPNWSKLVSIKGTTSGWVSETGSRTETTSPQFSAVAPPLGTLYAAPQATQNMLDDATFDVEAWLSGEIGEEFARAEGAAFVSGSGVNQPLGMTSGTPVSTADATRAFGTVQYVASGQAAAMPSAGTTLMDVVAALKAGYRSNASWVATKKSLLAVRKYNGTDSISFWEPSMQAGTPSMLLGYPVYEAEDFGDSATAGAFPMAFGDFRRGYLITDRVGVTLIRDNLTNKPHVIFYATKRVGGTVQNSEAIKLLKIAAS